ncbi:hypothetical protein DL89DRAFT_269795 [Linderina pennispora]|uniref:Core domain-containing protein n=1 Tax=Linderina pennispora TaxID=61395 RepID=A0A1Y1W0F8_9FUNG|nr:uncharacterized protein DL89DRAFT_269795 [Linderina pennispora]ORX66746.1 hypothetical protein DL89DRAFT_269795 [Linderina pennispora]
MNALLRTRTQLRRIGCLAVRARPQQPAVTVPALRYNSTATKYSLPKLNAKETAALADKIASYGQPPTEAAEPKPTGMGSEITLTDSAIKRLLYLSEKRNKTQYLRLRVDSGGCYGFSYMLDMTETPEENDIMFDRKGAKMVVDDVSLPLVQGATIDWQDRLIGQAFIVVANPQSSGGCGCGSSFEIKLD